MDGRAADSAHLQVEESHETSLLDMELSGILVIQKTRLREDTVQPGIDEVEALAPETIARVRIPGMDAPAKLKYPFQIRFEGAQPIIEAGLEGDSVGSVQRHTGQRSNHPPGFAAGLAPCDFAVHLARRTERDTRKYDIL